MTAQHCVLGETPAAAQFLQFQRRNPIHLDDFKALLNSAPVKFNSKDTGFGLSHHLTSHLKLEPEHHKSYPKAFEEHLEKLLSTNRVHQITQSHAKPNRSDLWVWLRDDSGNRGELINQGQALIQHLSEYFRVLDCTDAFNYRVPRSEDNHDLTGYVDGTENPTEEHAEQSALNQDGSSYLAAQIWQHDLNHFNHHHSQEQKDHIIGRRLSDNEELDDAPASAHTKRTAQEQFTPEAFIVRRSMPWSSGQQQGLYFLAFGHSFTAFEAQWQNMLGINDGIIDGLFQFSQVLDTQYYWCPPLNFLEA